jgi:hypothetical protein
MHAMFALMWNDALYCVLEKCLEGQGLDIEEDQVVHQQHQENKF